MNTHSESYIAAIHDGVEKLGICGRLTDSPATGTGRFGTLGIWRFTFGRFTLGRLLVKLLQKRQTERKKRIHNSGVEAAESHVTLISKGKIWNYVRTGMYSSAQTKQYLHQNDPFECSEKEKQSNPSNNGHIKQRIKMYRDKITRTPWKICKTNKL